MDSEFRMQTEAEAMWRGRFETRLLFKYRPTSLSFQTLTWDLFHLIIELFKPNDRDLKKGLFYGFPKIPKAEH